MIDRTTGVRKRSSRNGVVGALVSFYAFFDALTVGVLIIAMAAVFPWIVVFAIGLILLLVVNTASCLWLDREWDGWYLKYGEKVEKRLAKMREGKVMRKPVAWITSDSITGIALAAALTNAIITVSFARLIGGKPVGPRRARAAALSYSVFFAVVYSLVGLLIHAIV